VSAIPASGLAVELGTNETNGLTAIEDCPWADIGATVMSETTVMTTRCEFDTTPPD
jgi:hypothetical protein